MKPAFAQKWMKDFEAFDDALADETKATYMTDLTRSLSLVLDSFYENLSSVCVSSRTGEGMDEVRNTEQLIPYPCFRYWQQSRSARRNITKSTGPCTTS